LQSVLIGAVVLGLVLATQSARIRRERSVQHGYRSRIGMTVDRRLVVRPLLFDVGLVIVLLTLGLLDEYRLSVDRTGSFPRGGDLWGGLSVAAMVVPLIWRRRFPVSEMAVAGVAYFARLFVGYEPVGSADAAQLIAVYSVGVYAARPVADFARWVGGFVIAAGFLWAYRIDRFPLTEASFMFVTWVGVAVFGETVYVRRRYHEALEERARRLESERDERALVALGTLAAGLAHELNNPASAATRAVDALQETCDTLLTSLMDLAERSLSSEQIVALDALRGEIDSSSASVDPLAVADREEALIDWLDAHHVDQSWRLAPPLASAGVDVAWCEQVARLLDSASLGTSLEWVASTLSTTTLLSEIKESTGRVSDLVSTMKSYSQLDRASLQDIDVTEGIDSTLVVLGEKLHDGVTVVRDYADEVPRIEAIPGELNQVWTNVIDNAVDAMQGKGTLRVSTRTDGEHVVVEIADTGSGMPPDVQARAFEPFFTTKDVGKGTGLGLDISRRIVVERHQGEILIASQPRETVVTVKLPSRRT
jgi:signal transduction histidine kinase